MSDRPTIDVNITLGQWPMRRVPCDNPQELITKLRAHNVVEAWAGHYDGLFHEDLTSVNNSLAQACISGVPLAPGVQSSTQGEAPAEPVTQQTEQLPLIPFGHINPLAANWEAELARCADAHRMPGIRLHPNYHGYTLEDRSFAKLLKAAAERKLIVQLVAIMEDARMMHSLMRVPPTELAPLQKLVPQTPGLKLVLLNSLNTLRGDALFRLVDAGEVYVEISMIEGVGGIETLLKDIPAERVLFGSHAPSFYFESAVLKLQESQLSSARAILHDNAKNLLRPR
jgi:uncharacterized protein